MALTAQNRQRFIITTLELGGAPSAVTSILAKQAIQAAENAAPNELSEIKHDFQTLCGKLQGATSTQELQRELLSPLAQKYEVDRVLAQDILSDRVIPTASDFVARTMQREREMLVQEVGKAAAAAFGGSQAEAVYEILSQVVRPDGQVAPQIEDLLEGLSDELVDKLKDVASGTAELNGQAVGEFAESLKKEVQDRVVAQIGDALELAWGERGLKAGQVVAEAASLEWPTDLNKLGAVASTAQALLSVVGANDDAKKAVGYVQSGVQVGQALALLAAASTGWGAVIALGGLAQGLGGLGVFGRSDSQSAQQANAAVLAAIANLMAVMKQEFARVNQKLDQILDKLDELLTLAQNLGAGQQEILQAVKRVEAKVDEALVQMNRLAFVLTEEIRAGRHTACEGRWRADVEEWTKSSVWECASLYHRVVTTAGDIPAQQDFDGTPRARELVAQYFGQDLKNDHQWMGLNALAAVLRAYGLPGQERTVHGPAVRFAVENFAEVRLAAGSAYDSLKRDETRRWEEDIREVLAVHEDFQELLVRREAEAELPLVFETLLKNLQGRTDAVRDGVKTLYRVAAERFVQKIKKGGVGYPVQSGVLITNDDPGNDVVTGAGGTKTPSTHPQDRQWAIPLTSALPNLYASVSLGSHAKAPPAPLEVKVVDWRILHNNDYVGNWTANFTFKVYFHNQPLKTLFQTGDFVIAMHKPDKRGLASLEETHRGNPVRIIALADATGKDKAGTEKLAGMLEAYLNKAEVVAEVERIQADRVMGCTEVGVKQLATLLGQAIDFKDERPEWAAADAAIKQLRNVGEDLTAIRAVCRVGYEEAYEAYDSLKALFEGPDELRYVDWPYILAWVARVAKRPADYSAADAAISAGTALPVGDDAVPGELAQLLGAMDERKNKMRQALLCLVDSAQRRGQSFPFARAKARFELATKSVLQAQGAAEAGIVPIVGWEDRTDPALATRGRNKITEEH